MTTSELGGLNPKTDDQRDFQLGAIINWPKLKDLPKEYSVKPLSIFNQIADGNTDFCASCAGTGMIEPKEETTLYYPFLFAAAKYESGQDPDSWGLQLRDVGKALVKWGVPEVADVPEAVKNLSPRERRRFENYPAEVRAAAQKHCQKTYFFIEGPYDAYDNARAAQWCFRQLKQNVMFGVEFGWSLDRFFLDGEPHGFGHALWASGWYADGIQAVNSAGKDAGKGGLHKISRQTFNRFAKQYGSMMVVDLSREEVEYLLQNGIKVGDNWLLQLYKSALALAKDLLKLKYGK